MRRRHVRQGQAGVVVDHARLAAPGRSRAPRSARRASRWRRRRRPSRAGRSGARRRPSAPAKSPGGMTPPTTIMMSARPSFASSAFSSGTRVRWPAASELAPTTCTPSATARRAVSAGVSKRGPTSTSKPRSSKPVGDHLLAAVVAVLAHLGHQDRAARGRRPRAKAATIDLGARDRGVCAGLGGIDALHHLGLGLVAAEDLLQRQADLADRGLGAGGVDRQLQQVAAARARPRSAPPAPGRRRPGRARPSARSASPAGARAPRSCRPSASGCRRRRRAGSG